MMKTSLIVEALNRFLQPENFKDYAPNGLQVEGSLETSRVVCGVSASQALIDRAIEVGAQTIIVHHGYFWKSENPCITGIKKNRIQKLLSHNINLVAYHLPLDAHESIGNNALLGKVLGVQESVPLEKTPLVRIGRFADPITSQELYGRITKALGREPSGVLLEDQTRLVQTIAWCTGAAQDFLETASQAGAQAYLSGEISERTVLESRELNLPYYCVGHHASETLGISALAHWLQEQFNELEVQFINIDNPA